MLSAQIKRRRRPAFAILSSLSVLFVASLVRADDNPPVSIGTGGTSSLASGSAQSGAEALATFNVATGAAETSFPFDLIQARGAAQPSLSVSYSSRMTTVGLAGFGWTLNLPAIERVGAAGIPQFNDTTPSTANVLGDRYTVNGVPLLPLCLLDTSGTCSNALPGETFPVSSGWTYFRTLADDGNRYFFNATHDTWLMQTKSGVSFQFGEPLDHSTPAAIDRSAAKPLARWDLNNGAFKLTPTNNTDIYRWNLVRQVDESGNAVVYVWGKLEADTSSSSLSGPSYLTDIYDTLDASAKTITSDFSRYAHHTHLRWSDPDAQTKRAVQSPLWSARPSLRLAGIDVSSQSFLPSSARQLVRRYWLDYQWNPAHTVAAVSSIAMEGTCGASSPIFEDSASGLLPATACPRLPATTYSYSDWLNVDIYNSGPIQGRDGGPLAFIDIDGDGIPEVPHFKKIENRTNPNLPASKRHATVQDVDFNSPKMVLGDWLNDGLIARLWLDTAPLGALPARNAYEIYRGPDGFGPFPLPALYPNAQFMPDVQSGRAIDVDGDGLTDAALVPATTNGSTPFFANYSARQSDGTVVPFALLGTQFCMPDGFRAALYGNPTTRALGDMDGDGLADYIIFEAIPDDGPSTFGTTLRAHVFKGRGDGRFGLSTPSDTDAACADNAIASPSGSIDVTVAVSHNVDDLIANGLIAVGDADGDGYADVATATSSGVDVWINSHDSQTNDDVFDSFSGGHLQVSADSLHWGGSTPFTRTKVTLLTADADASGVQEFILFDNTGPNPSSWMLGTPPQWSAFKKTRPGLLTRISNGLGIQTSLEYRTAEELAAAYAADPDPKKHWSTELPIPAIAVTSITTTNGISGAWAATHRIDVDYKDPIYDARERSFVGFKQITTRLQGDALAPGTNTRTTFADLTCPGVSSGNPCAPTVDYFYSVRRGTPAVVETFDSNTQAQLTTVVRTIPLQPIYNSLDGRTVYRAIPTATDIYLWDPTLQDTVTTSVPIYTDPVKGSSKGSSVTVELPKQSKHLRQTTSYDLFGNINKIIDWGATTSFDGSDQVIITKSDWSLPLGDATGWNYRVGKVTVGYGDLSGNFLAGTTNEVDYSYDALGRLERVLAPISGVLPLDRAPNGAPAPADASTNSTIPKELIHRHYDRWGNLTLVERPGGRCQGYAYDQSYEQLPVTEMAFTNGCNGDALTSTRVFDRGLELKTSEVSPSNEMTLAAFDGFGRMTAFYDASTDPLQRGHISDLATLIYDYSKAEDSPVGKIHISRLRGQDGSSTYEETWQYVDGFGQSLVKLRSAESTDSWHVEGARQLSVGGAVTSVFGPSKFNAHDGSTFPVGNPIAPVVASFSYDAFGRTLTATDAAGKTWTTAYHPLELSIELHDPEQGSAGRHPGAYSKSFSDGHGRLTKSLFHSSDPSDEITSAITYLATGEATQIAQSHTLSGEKSTRWMMYDSLGRLVLNGEPNTTQNWSSTAAASSDMHGWRYAYNDNGDLVGTSDARGCGENFIYDQIGRLVAEDYSPCTSLQPHYSSPLRDSNGKLTGDGAEVFFVYDKPEAPDGLTDIAFVGRLSAYYDRAQHTRFTYDGRGRQLSVSRQLATPTLANDLTSRYTPHWFKRSVITYDAQGRSLEETTGADVPELLGGNSATSTSRSFYPGGALRSVSSSYSPLTTGTYTPIAQFDYNDDGSLKDRVLGDIAQTRVDLVNYLPNGLVHQLRVSRSSGPWKAWSAGYVAPSATDPNTFQGDLTNQTLDYDAVGNPLSVKDDVNTVWAPGAGTVSAHGMFYFDTYRLKRATYDYSNGGDDAFVSPYLGDPKFPVPRNGGNRVREEKFEYDWRGNLTSSSDNEGRFLERSIGKIVNGNGNAIDQVVSASNGAASLSVGYDEAGNLTSIKAERPDVCTTCETIYIYRWDEVGRMQTAGRRDLVSGAVNFEVAKTFTYDAFGQRVITSTKTVSAFGVVSPSAFDVQIFPSLRLDHATFPDTSGDYARTADTESVYITAGGSNYGHVVYAQSDPATGTSGKLHAFLELGDTLGSSSFVLDAETSEVVERTSYQSYGSLESDFRPDRWGQFREKLKFTGQADDSEVGLTYFGSRYFAQVLGRWTSPDPMTIHGLGADANPYAYVAGAPSRLIDPDGLDAGNPLNDDGRAYGCDELSEGCGYNGMSSDAFGQVQDVWLRYNHDYDVTIGRFDNVHHEYPHPPPKIPAPGQIAAGNQPLTIPLWAVFQHPAVLSSPVPVAPVANEFNAGIDKHSTELGAAGVLAGAQVAVLSAPTAARGYILVQGATNELALQSAARFPQLVSATAIGTSVLRGLNGNTTTLRPIDSPYGAEAVQGAVLEAGENLEPELEQLVVRNKRLGDALRDEIAASLEAEGREVETEVMKRTPFGRRFIDIEVRMNGKLLGGVEVKLGNSAYGPLQRVKDTWLLMNDKYRVNVVRVPRKN